MKLKIIAVSHKSPNWIAQGFDDYYKRLNAMISTQVCTISPAKRQKNASSADIDKYKKAEAAHILSAKSTKMWLLDVKGKQFSTETLAAKLQNVMQDGQDVCFVIGGADGVDISVRQHADLVWSLSDLTLPHPLASVVLIEQLYRAMSIIYNHPYHRA